MRLKRLLRNSRFMLVEPVTRSDYTFEVPWGYPVFGIGVATKLCYTSSALVRL
jgi:hypothetical protein